MIYFVQADWGGPVKIGYTQGDPLNRVADLQIGNPSKLVLRYTAYGDKRHEAQIHARLAGARIRGEWFRLGRIGDAIPAIKNPRGRNQLGEQRCCPWCGRSSVVERDVANVEVAGSIPAAHFSDAAI